MCPGDPCGGRDWQPILTGDDSPCAQLRTNTPPVIICGESHVLYTLTIRVSFCGSHQIRAAGQPVRRRPPLVDTAPKLPVALGDIREMEPGNVKMRRPVNDAIVPLLRLKDRVRGAGSYPPHDSPQGHSGLAGHVLHAAVFVEQCQRRISLPVVSTSGDQPPSRWSRVPA
jgi:hypothetical protein